MSEIDDIIPEYESRRNVREFRLRGGILVKDFDGPLDAGDIVSEVLAECSPRQTELVRRAYRVRYYQRQNQDTGETEHQLVFMMDDRVVREALGAP